MRRSTRQKLMKHVKKTFFPGDFPGTDIFDGSNNYSIDEVKAFMSEYFHISNFSLSITGEFDQEGVENIPRKIDVEITFRQGTFAHLVCQGLARYQAVSLVGGKGRGGNEKNRADYDQQDAEMPAAKHELLLNQPEAHPSRESSI